MNLYKATVFKVLHNHNNIGETKHKILTLRYLMDVSASVYKCVLGQKDIIIIIILLIKATFYSLDDL